MSAIGEFKLDSRVKNDLYDVFDGLIREGGIKAVKDILHILSITLALLSDMYYDQASIEISSFSKRKLQKLGNEAQVISQRIERFIKSGLLYG